MGRLYPRRLDSVRPLVLYNSRKPRPGEQDGVDYHFRPRAEIERLRKDPGHLVMDVRGDLQALDLSLLASAEGDLLFEGNPFVGAELMRAPLPGGFGRLGVFISPLSMDEIQRLRQMGADVRALLAEMMRRKLLRRGAEMMGHLSLPALEEVERRATSAWKELRLAHRFDWVLPNHDGEDSEHWDAYYYPVGDALRTMDGLLELWAGRSPAWAERWREGQLPETREREDA